MSSDIVEQLCHAANENAEDGSLMHEAAAEIERLRSELELARVPAIPIVVLQKIADYQEEIERQRRVCKTMPFTVEEVWEDGGNDRALDPDSDEARTMMKGFNVGERVMVKIYRDGTEK